MADARTGVLDAQLQEAHARTGDEAAEANAEQQKFQKRRQAASRMQFLHMLMGLWIPFAKVYSIGAVLDEKGNCISDDIGVSEALSQGWFQTFSWQPHDSDAAKDLLMAVPKN
eukprot:5622126-Karenia_brevis.AAC.1